MQDNNNKNLMNSYNNDINTQPPKTKMFYCQSILADNTIPNLCKELTSTENIDEDVERYLVEMANNFISVTIDSAISLAKNRKSDKVTVEDLASAVNDNFGICEPSKYTSTINQMNINSSKNISTSDHKKRMELTKEETKNVNL